jgi:hypothetical protein
MAMPMHFSEYGYRGIMAQCEFNPALNLWTLPGHCFPDFEADSPLLFTSKYEAHEYVIKRLCN